MDSLALADNGYEAFDRTMRGMPVAEPDPEIPSMADSVDIPMARGDIPNPGEPHSPEHMASWMAGRLTPRMFLLALEVVMRCFANTAG